MQNSTMWDDRIDGSIERVSSRVKKNGVDAGEGPIRTQLHGEWYREPCHAAVRCCAHGHADIRRHTANTKCAIRRDR